MNVDRLMTREPDCCSPQASILDASRKMKAGGVGMLPVVEGGQPVGVITDRDVCMAVADQREATATVGQVMTRPAICCGQWDSPRAALESMREKRVRRVVVIDDGGSICGVVSLDDLAAEARDRVREHVPSHAEIVETLRAVSRYGNLQLTGA